MAIPTPIQLRRDILGVDPLTGDLKEGELGYAYASDKLFIGGPAALSVIPVGGASFIELLTATPGVATADKAVILDSNTEIDVWTVVGQVESNTFKTSASVNAGFVKNDLSGNLLFGQSGEQTDLDLDNLADVTITTPVNGEVLTFVAGEWVNSLAPASSLDDLSDVIINSVQAGDFLRFTGVVFTNTPLSVSDLPAHTHTEAEITDLQAYLLPTDSIDSLADVDTTTTIPIIGEHLQWDGFDWVPGPAAGLGAVTELDDLSDVTITTPATDSLLQFDGSQWIDQADLVIDSGAATYWGPITANDTWRMIRSGNDISFQRREFGIYVEKAKFLPASFLTSGSCTAGSYVISGVGQVGFIKHDSSGNFIFEDLIEPGDLPTGGYDLDDLGDVSVLSPGTGDHLEWNGSSWIAAVPGHTAPGASALNDLSDVTLTIEAEGDFLRLNGSGQFVNTTLVDADIPANLDVADLSAAGSGIDFFDVFDNQMFAMDRGGFPAVNWFNTFNAVTGVNPVFRVVGSDTNIGMRFITKGSGTFQLFPGSIAGAAGPLGLDASGNITFDSLTLTDADIPNELTIRILTGTSATPSGADIQINDAIGNEVFDMKRAGSAVNYVRLWNAGTGAAPFFEVLGEDTDIDFELHAKGTGAVRIVSSDFVVDADGLFDGSIILTDAATDPKAVYWGDPSTNGSWRIILISGTLHSQKLIAGTWTDEAIDGTP